VSGTGGPDAAVAAPGRLRRFLAGDVWYSFRRSPVAIAAAVVAFTCLFCAVFADVVAPHDPFDLASLELADSRLPPAWQDEGRAKYLLGTDDQGRDILSALMYGSRISLVRRHGRGAGVDAGGRGAGAVVRLRGRQDRRIHHACVRRDVVLPVHPGGLADRRVGRALFPNAHDTLAFAVLIVSISLTGWVQYARTVRGSTLVERNKEYVQAARVTGVRRCASCAVMCCPTCSGR
jgi:peptide/nickel transport system permease protein